MPILIAVICLSALGLIISVLPFLAALNHVTYELNGMILTAIVGSLAGIATAMIKNATKSDD